MFFQCITFELKNLYDAGPNWRLAIPKFVPTDVANIATEYYF